MKRKFILKLEGGLGNQLFQYAHVVALQKAFGGEIIIDKHAFTGKQTRACALENYALTDRTRISMSVFDKIISYSYIALCRAVRRYVWVKDPRAYKKFVKFGLYYQCQFSWYDSMTKPSLSTNYVTGNWLSEKFFKTAEKEVRNAYTYQKPLPEKCIELLDDIRTSESVCIHIRLGDYLSPKWKDKLYICTPEYYRKAMEEIGKLVEKPKFFVFSNRHKDFEMIQAEYNLGSVTFVDMGNSDVEDMELMRNCKHFIMSNSTYSWWGQYLSDYQDKKVMAPSRFSNYPRWDMRDIYQDNWKIIEL